MVLAILVCFVATVVMPARAESLASDAVSNDQAAARLISAVTGGGDLTTVPLGLQMTLKPGWKTYWRSPGDAGFPLTIDFTGSKNLADADLSWPIAHRFQLFGLQTFGYEDQVVFPIAAHPEIPGQPMTIRAQIHYLVCATVCIPEEAQLVLGIPAAPADLSDDAPLINRFRALVPGNGAASGLRLTQLGVSRDGDLVADIASDSLPLLGPDILIEGPNSLQFGAPLVDIADDALSARLIVPVKAEPSAPKLKNTELTLTITDDQRGLEVKARPTTTGLLVDRPGDRSIWLHLLPILGVALLGGLILNVMPCVLPVLALKLAGLADHAGQERQHIRLSFLATAAGILTAFILLAAALIGLKLSGAAIGWGIQFQQPVFLGFMLLVCLGFAANLFGWFEFSMPRFAGTVTVDLEDSDRHPLTKSFLIGMLATLLATPCSAPFVGTAVGFALSRGSGEILAIFVALGIGLAAPYLLVAGQPRLAAWLPRPGRWMVWLKRGLALALIGSALWLGSVLAARLGWLDSGANPTEAAAWDAFDEARIAELVRDHKVVFIDVTAAWCVTCQANKRLVLDQPPVADRLQQPGLVRMQADWTKPNDVIARYLAAHGRYGIPFNIVYGPAATTGIILPELLTSDAVLKAVARAAGS
ncbi:MAG TPA: protein-disulfide reductase DsbD domain-containing protein [Dongiaceae bacterium]|nr:protein-disulfide reductase DsbD domain-containing protein [Dongiaceae bacterium]